MSLHEAIIDGNAGRQEVGSAKRVGRNRRSIGTLCGLKVYRFEDKLHLPNTPAGRALALLLTGRQFPNRGDIVIPIIECANLSDVIGVLGSLQQDIAPEAANPIRATLERIGVREPALSKLSADAWITVQCIDAHWLDLMDRGEDNPIPKLIRRLSDHWEPIVSIAAAQSQDRYSKYEGWE